MINAKEIADFIHEAALDDPENHGPINDTFQRKEQIWVRTTDNQVFRVTIELDDTVKPEEFDEE